MPELDMLAGIALLPRCLFRAVVRELKRLLAEGGPLRNKGESVEREQAAAEQRQWQMQEAEDRQEEGAAAAPTSPS